MRSTIWKKVLICLGAVLFLESPVVSSASAYTVKAENTDAEAATSNIKSILLIGQDKREGESRQRSDSMILATLDKDQRTVSLTSFMRDLYVAIPGYSTTRINAAYAYGGMELLDATLEENFGVKIDGNVEVDFEVFQVLVDKVGGIDLELTQAEADYICGRDQSVLYSAPSKRLESSGRHEPSGWRTGTYPCTQPFYWKFRLSENRAAAGSTYGCFCQDKRSGSF